MISTELESWECLVTCKSVILFQTPVLSEIQLSTNWSYWSCLKRTQLWTRISPLWTSPAWRTKPYRDIWLSSGHRSSWRSKEPRSDRKNNAGRQPSRRRGGCRKGCGNSSRTVCPTNRPTVLPIHPYHLPNMHVSLAIKTVLALPLHQLPWTQGLHMQFLFLSCHQWVKPQFSLSRGTRKSGLKRGLHIQHPDLLGPCSVKTRVKVCFSASVQHMLFTGLFLLSAIIDELTDSWYLASSQLWGSYQAKHVLTSNHMLKLNRLFTLHVILGLKRIWEEMKLKELG